MGNYDISSEIDVLQKKIKKLTVDLEEMKNLYDRAGVHTHSLETRLIQEIEINQQYREWFRQHEYVVNKRPEPITSLKTFFTPPSPVDLSTVDGLRNK